MQPRAFCARPAVRLAVTVAFGAALVMGLCDPSAAAEPRPLVEDIIPVPDQVPVTEGLAELSNGVKLWYWDTGGEGEAIVLAHPYSGNHESWIYQQPVFAKAGYRVIAYSRRGFYKSETGPEGDVGTQAGDLKLLMDHLGIDKAHLLGAAAGGSTVLDFVLSYPDRAIDAAIMSSILSIRDDDFRDAIVRPRGDWFRGLDIEFQELSPSFRTVYPGGVALWKEIHEKNPERGSIPRQPTEANITWETLTANQVPLLLTTGGADIWMPPELLLRAAERIPSAEVYIFPNAGHPVFAEYPEAFNEKVLTFFGNH